MCLLSFPFRVDRLLRLGLDVEQRYGELVRFEIDYELEAADMAPVPSGGKRCCFGLAVMDLNPARGTAPRHGSSAILGSPN